MTQADIEKIREEVVNLGKRAKEAASRLVKLTAADKTRALKAMADALEGQADAILAQNARDVSAAERAGLPRPMLKRLTLTPKSIHGMAEGLRQVADLPDPVGEIESMTKRPNGLLIGRMRVPLGVVGVIYESRPNVTADAIALCLKTSNAVILRGGSEALASNQAITKALWDAASSHGVPEGSFSLIANAHREAAVALMKLQGYVDLLIPRGSASLIETVKSSATVPVVETGVGNCHVYVDRDADLEMARKIALNAKVSNPAVCNAAETLLVHEAIAAEFLPGMIEDLMEHGVEVRGCPKTREICPSVLPATEEDWATEYLDLIYAVKVVKDLDEALSHIRHWGTRHSEAIITENYSTGWRFLNEVDAAAVYINASTRFTDGFEFGLGAEIGISTQKLHARGPMGLKELTTTKYVIFGGGQVR